MEKEKTLLVKLIQERLGVTITDTWIPVYGYTPKTTLFIKVKLPKKVTYDYLNNLEFKMNECIKSELKASKYFDCIGLLIDEED